MEGDRAPAHLETSTVRVKKVQAQVLFFVKFQFSLQKTPFGTKLSLNASKLMPFDFNQIIKRLKTKFKCSILFLKLLMSQNSPKYLRNGRHQD